MFVLYIFFLFKHKLYFCDFIFYDDFIRFHRISFSGAGCGENHAHPDLRMKLCPNIHYCKLFETFSLANPN